LKPPTGNGELEDCHPTNREETFGSLMRVIKKSWEGIQPEAPTMGNKNISYIEMGTL